MRSHALVLALSFVAGVPLASAQEPSDAPQFEDQRLFTTAPQREHLDALREGLPPPERPADSRREREVPVPEQEQAKKPPAVNLQGFIRRSDGRSAVWANGQSTLNGDFLADDLRIDIGGSDGNSVVVQPPDGRRIRLAPGQRWDPDTDRVIDGFRR